jgi:hypothetical protein
VDYRIQRAMTMSNTRKARWSMVGRFLFAYVAMGIVAAASLVALVVHQQEKALEDEVTKRGEAVVRLCSRILTGPLYQLDVDAIENHIRHTRELADIEQVLTFTDKGQCITDGTPTNPSLGANVTSAAGLFQSPAAEPRMEREANRLRFLQTSRLGDRVVGGVQIEFSLENVHAQVIHLWRLLAGIAMGALIFGTIPVWLVVKFLLEPLFFGSE